MSRFRSFIRAIRPEPVFMTFIFRMAGVYALFLLCRIIFAGYNHSYFTFGSARHMLTWLWGGLIFDTVAILYVNILYIILVTLPLQIRYRGWYRKILTVIFVVTNSIALAANLADVFYYPFTLARTTASVFRQFANEQNMAGLFLKFFIDYWYGTLAFVALILCLVWLARITRSGTGVPKRSIGYYLRALILMVLTFTLFIGGVRGGYKHSTRPITLSNAGQYVKEPNEVSIVLNTPFCVLKTLEINTFTRINYFTPGEADRLYPVIHVPPEDQVMNKKNVVIIILESFGKEFFGFFNRDQGADYRSFTPFLDSLCTQSLTFRYSYANGRKSIDIMPTVLVSIPSVVEPFVLTESFTNRMQSLPFLLRQEGYHSSFFHGAPNGSMGYLAFSNLIGIDSYYGLNEYGNKADFDGYWAIWDEEFFQYFARQLGTQPHPFVSTIFSASSHHPFELPQRYTGKFPEGPHPINRCIAYTDMAIRRFFEIASKQDWYPNTLFVITADHCQSQPSKEIYRTPAGSFEVPVIFFTPDGSLKGEDPRLMQQIDIMPVVLGQLKYNKPYFAFGNDVLHGDGHNSVVNYINGTYQLFYGDYLIIADPKQTRGVYRFKTDRLLKENLTGKAGAIQDTLEMKVKAFMQQYNNRMLENRISMP